jgi:hypothetical protein
MVCLAHQSAVSGHVTGALIPGVNMVQRAMARDPLMCLELNCPECYMTNVGGPVSLLYCSTARMTQVLISVICRGDPWHCCLCAAVPPELLDTVLETGAVRCRHCRTVSTLGGITKEDCDKAMEKLAQMSIADEPAQVYLLSSAATMAWPVKQASQSGGLRSTPAAG